MQFDLNLVRVLLLIALAAAQRANAELGCANNWLYDTSKCWTADINRVFGGSMTSCNQGYGSSGLPYASTRAACDATALKINAHEGYDGPDLSCGLVNTEAVSTIILGGQMTWCVMVVLVCARTGGTHVYYYNRACGWWHLDGGIR